MNNIWNKLYKNYINKEYNSFDEYYIIKMKLKRKFNNLVIRYSKSGKPILECGCGTGKGIVYLASKGLKTYAIDLEEDMIKQTDELSKKICPQNRVNSRVGNIENIPFEDKYFSVTLSSGVLEHYSDKEIIQLINEQLRVSDCCIFSVPTKYFDTKMLGNERFMTRKEWKKIISKSNAKIIKNFGYHYKSLKGRINDILKKPSNILKPIALFGFVLKEKD